MKYFLETVPEYLKKLTPEAQPKWGELNASAMLRHLRLGLKGSLEIADGELNFPSEKLPRAKAFLMSDKPFPQSAPMPYFYHNQPDVEDYTQNLEDLLAFIPKFVEETQKRKNFVSFHPSFGHLNAEETLQLHFKHFRHHLQQFGLYPE